MRTLLGLKAILLRLPDVFESTKCTPGFVEPSLDILLGTVVCTDHTPEKSELFNLFQRFSIMLIGLSASELTHIILDFFLLMISPVFLAFVLRSSDVSWGRVGVEEKMAISPAKSRSWRWEKIVHCIPRERREVALRITQSIVRRKRIGESIHPWRTPDFTGNASVMVFPRMIPHSKLS